MIYYPCFGTRPSFYGGSQDDFLRDCVSIEKDVEGLCHTYRFNLYHNIRYLDADQRQKCILPCTPLALVKVVEHLGYYDAAKPSGQQLHGKARVRSHCIMRESLRHCALSPGWLALLLWVATFRRG